MNISFDCKEFMQKISFPRLAGTGGERKAQEIIEKELKSLNIKEYKKDSFIYTKFFMNFLLRIYNPSVGWVIIILYFLLLVQIYYLAFILAYFLLFFAFFGREIREKIQFKFTTIGKKYGSYNYMIELNAQEKEVKNTQNIIILVHYDSISHGLHPIFDGIIYIFALIGGTIFSLHLILVVFLFLFNVFSSIIITQFIYGLFLAAFYNIELLNSRHNKSHGTADNGTAMASAFFISKYFNNNRLKKTNLIIVFTGAEEFGDYGADAFIKKYHNVFNKNNSYFFIIDTIGANEKTNLYARSQGMLPKRIFSPIIENNIKKLLNNKKGKDYKIKPLYIPPLIHYSTDHAPLKTFGYEFMIFLSNGPIHSERDNINNYYLQMLESFNEFIKDLIIQMDEFA